MQIKILTKDQYESWNSFVEKQPLGSFFHLAEWQEVIRRAFGHTTYYMYAEEQGNIAGILPLVHVKSFLFGNALVSTPFCVYGGILAQDQSVRVKLEEAAVEKANALKVDHLEMRYQKPVNTDWPTKSDLYVTFRKEIDPDPEVNMKNIPRKQRAMVRKGIKAELHSERVHEIDAFYDVYAESVRNLGTPVFSKRYFQILNEVFRDKSDVLLVRKENKIVSGVMSFYFRDEVLPYYGGSISEARAYKANDFMYWELMRQCGEAGIKIFDYGRSKRGTGSYSFKKNWGFEPEPLYYEYYMVKNQEIPDINPLNPKYQLFINVWKKMPLFLTKIVGPPIVKNLG